MNTTTKGVRWVGNMCKKLQTKCTDVFQEMDLIAQDCLSPVKEQDKISGEMIEDFSSEDLQGLFADVDVVNDPPDDSSIIYSSDASLLNERDEDSVLSNSDRCEAQESEDNMSCLFRNPIGPLSPIKPTSTVVEEVADMLKNNLDMNNSPEVDAEDIGLAKAKVYQSHIIPNEMYFSSLSRRHAFGDNIFYPTSIFTEDLAGGIEYHHSPASMESTSTNKPETINSSSLVDGKEFLVSVNAKIDQSEGIEYRQRPSEEDTNEPTTIHSSSLYRVNSKGSFTLEALTLSDATSASRTPLIDMENGTSDSSKSTISFHSIESGDQMGDGIEEFTDIFLGETHLNVEEEDAGEENASDEELDIEISFLYQQVAMRKSVSYKKKLQDALLAKWLSIKKSNNRKEAVLYRNTLDNNVGSYHNPDADQTGSKKVVKHCFSEPGWEFI